MQSVSEIKSPIEKELKTFEEFFKNALKSNVSLMDKISHYIIKRKGKQMRPMFVFLTAKMLGEVNNSTFIAASMIELLHTATLVHDDVVDEANKRRGFFSINALWKNKIAVLVGDYLLSKGLLLAIDNDEFDLLRIMSVAVREMSEGELLQIKKSRKLDISEEVYYNIIRQKTASLIAASCQAGAASVKNDQVELLHQFGENCGMAFQIKDDLFDFGLGGKIGKPIGIDIKEKKMTLPLIYALENTSSSERKRILRLVKNHKEDTKKIKEVIDFVLNSDGIVYATKKMIEYKDKALEAISSFENNDAKQSLIGLVNYTIERTK